MQYTQNNTKIIENRYFVALTAGVYPFHLTNIERRQTVLTSE